MIVFGFWTQTNICVFYSQNICSVHVWFHIKSNAVNVFFFKDKMFFWSTKALQSLPYSEQLQRKNEIRSQTEKCNSLHTVEREQYCCLGASEANLCHIQIKHKKQLWKSIIFHCYMKRSICQFIGWQMSKSTMEDWFLKSLTSFDKFDSICTGDIKDKKVKKQLRNSISFFYETLNPSICWMTNVKES